MIISLRLKNFYSLRDDAVLDFTADLSSKKRRCALPENLIDYADDKFVNIIGLFGSNAAGKSNMIKAIDFCRNLVLNSHLNNEGDAFEYSPFKFDVNQPSEFYIDFVTEGVEYEYSFEILDGRIISENLFHYPNKRKAKVFSREKNGSYYYGKGAVPRAKEVEANTGPKTLFVSRASSMNRAIAQAVYRFFLNEMIIGIGDINFATLSQDRFESEKSTLLRAFEVSDSDIIDIRLVESAPGKSVLLSYHKENPEIPFNFEKEESDGTKRLLYILLLLLDKLRAGATVILDEFDLKLHLRLAEFLLDVVRASRCSQLVFTSHNPYLMNVGKLRLEQIVIVNKDSTGNSEFTPLSDFTGLNYDTDVMKGYLQGRYDGVPYVGNADDVIEKYLSDGR